jgi:acetoin utilization protein AcuB
MKVKERMTRDVKTVELDTSLTEAFKIMKESNIRRLPVMDKGKLTGIVTLSDLNHAAPSSATTLSIHELNYILAKTKIKDIIPKKQKLITIGPDNYIETAAKIMRANNVGALPVIDNGQLVGIVTETNMFDALIDILGVTKTHARIDICAADRPGSLAEIINIIASKGINIINSVVYEEKEKVYKIILRIEEINCDHIVEEIKKAGYNVESVIVKREGEL